jgi:hypothetical protein
MSKIRGNQGQGKGRPVPPIEALSSELMQERFISKLRTDPMCSTKAACEHSGIRLRDLPRLLTEDKAFREAYEEIQAAYNAGLEETLHDRATRDNTLLKWLLQQRMPEKYGVGAGVNLNVNVTADQFSEMTTEQLEELRCRLKKS